MQCDDGLELFPVVDAEGHTVGRATRAECHGGSMLLHPVVHLHLFDAQGGLYLQKRPAWKDIQPGRWDTAVGGHVACGETIEEALRREVREELGIVGFRAEEVRRYVFRSSRECELVHVFRTVWEGPVTPSDELDGGRFWIREEIRRSLGRGVFTSNFEHEFETLLS
ncbi:MAG: NUDIX domain-containing protein [Alistipes sp.]|nr:NUDIX domain-containing protein [Alistipes sp.]